MTYNVREWTKYFKGVIDFQEQVSMNSITSFKTGGPADILIRPRNRVELSKVMQITSSLGVTPYILGGCTNVLVADKGISGITILMDQFELEQYHISESSVLCSAGIQISDLAWGVGHHGCRGIECFYRLPGTLGGAIWMNASCYGASIGNTLESVTTMNLRGDIEKHSITPEMFSYKHSPFQEKKDHIILDATIHIIPDNPAPIITRMLEIQDDRITKGHFSFPSGGSVFKNLPNLASPVGKLLDSIDVKGYSCGGAAVADYHANIVVNRGNASSQDVATVVQYLERQCKDKLGYSLEREIQWIGLWDEE